MPDKAGYKSHGGDKDSASKNTFNPPGHGEHAPGSDVPGTEEQDPKRRIGQFGGAGQPPIQKK